MLVDFETFVNLTGKNAIPKAELKINFIPFPVVEMLTTIRVHSVDIEMSVENEASICTVVLKSNKVDNFVSLPGMLMFKSDGEYSGITLGAKMEVSLGYQNMLVPNMPLLPTDKVWEGYVSGFEYSIDQFPDGSGILTVTLNGMDGKIWLMSSKKSEVKLPNQYSLAITSTLAPYMAKFLPPPYIMATGEPALQNQIFQDNQSDYEFICDCAKKLGAWFFVSKGQINVVRPTEMPLIPTPVIIKPSAGVRKLSLSTNIVGIPSSVAIYGFNDKAPKVPMQGMVMTSLGVGLGLPPVALTTNLSKSNTINIIDDTLSTPADAMFFGQSEFILRSFKLCEVRLELFGVQELALFSRVQLINWGYPIDNTYVVTKIEHHFDLDASSFYTIAYLATDKYTPQLPI